MEILIDVNQSPQGRLTGTARLPAAKEALAFSGTIELLASVEELCPRSLSTAVSLSSPGDARTVAESKTSQQHPPKPTETEDSP
jgi:hypothetical protein